MVVMAERLEISFWNDEMSALETSKPVRIL